MEMTMITKIALLMFINTPKLILMAIKYEEFWKYF